MAKNPTKKQHAVLQKPSRSSEIWKARSQIHEGLHALDKAIDSSPPDVAVNMHYGVDFDTPLGKALKDAITALCDAHKAYFGKMPTLEMILE